MPGRKASQREQTVAVNERPGFRVLVAVAVVLSLLAAWAMLTHSGPFDSAASEKKIKQVHSITPTSVSSTTPAAKEYIYAGGRLMVTEEPSVFTGCLVDDSNAGNVVLFNASTADYRFCCDGVTAASGRGTLSVVNATVNIHQVKGDRTVDISVTGTGQGSGSATVQKTGRGIICQISDTNMAGDSCTCP